MTFQVFCDTAMTYGGFGTLHTNAADAYRVRDAWASDWPRHRYSVRDQRGRFIGRPR